MYDGVEPVGEGEGYKERGQDRSQAVYDSKGKRQTHDQDEDFHPCCPHPCMRQRDLHHESMLLDGHVLAEWLFDSIQQTHELIDVM